MMSLPGVLFGIINIVGNFGTVFVDQSYWQSAIAASPGSAHKGYLLGGLVWFTIPFALATSLGLAGNALNVALSANDAGTGLVPPASATALMGNGGGILMIIMLFMAITSTGSAECIAVASLWAYDCYRQYINKNATACIATPIVTLAGMERLMPRFGKNTHIQANTGARRKIAKALID